MSRERLPLQALPAWMDINDAAFSNVAVKPISHKGNGLIAQRDLAAVVNTPVLTIPPGLVLSAEAVEEYAKEDRNFSQLLQACGHKSAPRYPLVPVSSERERILLQGTSLETALNAKMLALVHEFDELREKSSDIAFWNVAFWDSGLVHLTDWYLVDAWYRSRVLELPRSGPSLVPCIDMANHSKDANAYYEENSRDEVLLLLRPGSDVKEGDEVTISYGSGKSAAEMLFSYGFIDSSSTTRSIRLPLSPMPDDPLGKAKAHIFKGPQTVEVCEVAGKTAWTSAFAYLMVLNEEDGLGFKVLQDNDGGRELRIFWLDEDVTDQSGTFETLISNHRLCDVFRLRVNMVIYQRLQEQLDTLSLPIPEESDGEFDFGDVEHSNAANARALRRIETDILEKTVGILEQKASSASGLVNTSCTNRELT
ncbi:hypothetical protein SLS53_003514 [Cytospora paraplurivora]|uniref:SET domain-containing protein n=1 Tax=Cytospora paraplurivora TaxID=2898453 RepID=A0AAN9UBL5_9PEZI